MVCSGGTAHDGARMQLVVRKRFSLWATRYLKSRSNLRNSGIRQSLGRSKRLSTCRRFFQHFRRRVGHGFVAGGCVGVQSNECTTPQLPVGAPQRVSSEAAGGLLTKRTQRRTQRAQRKPASLLCVLGVLLSVLRVSKNLRRGLSAPFRCLHGELHPLESPCGEQDND